jgi:hypothetical protein
LAERAIGGRCRFGFGPAASAGLRRLPGGGDQLGNEISIRPLTRSRGSAVPIRRLEGDKSRAHLRLLSQNGTLMAFSLEVASAVPQGGDAILSGTFRIA